MPKSLEPIWLPFLLVIGAPTTGVAQFILPAFALGPGITAPTGEYHSDALGHGFSPGWQGMALIDLAVHSSGFGLRVEGLYGRNTANDKLKADLTTLFGVPADQRIRLAGAALDVSYAVRSVLPLTPYILAGVGFYNINLSMTSGGATRDTSLTEFGWNAGGGVRHRVGGVSVFLEARFLSVARVLNQGRYYGGTFYHTDGIQVEQVGMIAGVRFGTE